MSNDLWSGKDAIIYSSLHPDMQRVVNEAKRMAIALDNSQHGGPVTLEFTLIVGWRSHTEQLAAVAKGKSKLKFGAHNTMPARAVDFLPSAVVHNGKIDWNAIPKFRAVAHLLMLAAHNVGVLIRWGGDWDRDGDESDEKGLRDFDHVELFPWQTYGGVQAVPA